MNFGLPADSSQAIALFTEQITNLNESDYGDFMRSINLYLCDLLANPGAKDPRLHEKLHEIQAYIQFLPNWDIESTRARLLADCHELNSTFGNTNILLQ